MTTTPDVEQDCARLEERLAAGDHNGALRLLGPLLRLGPTLTPTTWARLHRSLAPVVRAKYRDEAGAAADAATDPRDPETSYRLGFALHEAGAIELALGVLHTAHHHSPHDTRLLDELLSALEVAGLHDQAATILHTAATRQDLTFHQRYLRIFNHIARDDTDGARRLLPTWGHPTTPTEHHLHDRIHAMLARADTIADIPHHGTRLRHHHYVMTGSLLAITAPDHDHGHLHGGYARTWDDPARILVGLRAVEIAHRHLTTPPPEVLSPPDEDSQILGQCLAALLDLPFSEWFGDDEPGIVAIYDAANVIPELRQPLRRHHPGQTWTAHTSSSLRERVATPDLITYLCESNTSPWGPGISPDNTYIPRTDAPVADLVDAVLTATPTPEHQAQLAAFDDFVTAISRLEGPDTLAAPALAQDHGPRERAWVYAPHPDITPLLIEPPRH